MKYFIIHFIGLAVRLYLLGGCSLSILRLLLPCTDVRWYRVAVSREALPGGMLLSSARDSFHSLGPEAAERESSWGG